MDESPLAKLPPELRNLIYEYALTADRPYSISVRSASLVPKSHRDRGVLSLTHTCKTIRTESTPLFYALNEFVYRSSDAFRYEGWLFPQLLDFRRAIGEVNALAIRTVTIDCGCCGLLYQPTTASQMELTLGRIIRAGGLFTHRVFTVNGSFVTLDPSANRCLRFDFALRLSDLFTSLEHLRVQLKDRKDEIWAPCLASTLGQIGRLEKSVCGMLSEKKPP